MRSFYSDSQCKDNDRRAHNRAQRPSDISTNILISWTNEFPFVFGRLLSHHIDTSFDEDHTSRPLCAAARPNLCKSRDPLRSLVTVSAFSLCQRPKSCPTNALPELIERATPSGICRGPDRCPSGEVAGAAGFGFKDTRFGTSTGARTQSMRWLAPRPENATCFLGECEGKSRPAPLTLPPRAPVFILFNTFRSCGHNLGGKLFRDETSASVQILMANSEPSQKNHGLPVLTSDGPSRHAS
jgi:hypothetical protein